MRPPLSFRRLRALCRKETLQILRDPSSNIIAFFLPVLLLFIFSYGINLDSTSISLGLVLEDTSPEARQFADALVGSPYLRLQTYPSQAAVADALVAGQVRGFVVVPQDFSQRLRRPAELAPIQVVADGAEPTIAKFVENYVRGAWRLWLQQRAADQGLPPPQTIRVEPRFWFNPSAQSRNFLVPGSITIIMTVIGALLSSLVVAREWERGTMEALLSSPVTRTELLLSKLLPYYALGMISLLICVAVAVFLLRIPFRGSLLALLLVASFFLVGALGWGLLLSTLTRNQFNAAQAALQTAFLPAVMLSGFIFEIRSMPEVIRAVTYLVPARYFVRSLQTLFQAGNLWPILARDLLFLLAAAALFLGLTALRTRRRLE